MRGQNELPSEEELSKLPPFSIAVYALRCALRVQPFWTLWKKPTAEYKEAVVNLKAAYKILVYDATAYNGARAARAAETVDTARDRSDNTDNTDNTETAVRAVRAAYNGAAAYTAETDTDTAAFAAFAAYDAARVSAAAYNVAAAYANNTDTALAARDGSDDTDTAVKADNAKLKELKTKVTDASETGPLGDLWHGSPPGWYLEAKEKFDKTIAEWEREIAEEEGKDLAKRIEESDPAPLISIYFDDSGFTDEEVSVFLEFVSETYRTLDGVGIKVINGKSLSPAAEEVVK